jgi:anti-sigma factor RsiW
MRCVIVQNMLDRYRRQELAPGLQEQIEAHINECEECRGCLARQERLAIVLKNTPESPSIPEGFSERLLVVARERQATQRPVPESIWRMRWLRSSTSLGMKAAQTAVLVGGVLIGVLMGQQTWRSAHTANRPQTTQADVYELGYLTNAPGDSLAGTYLTLMASPKHNGM